MTSEISKCFLCKHYKGKYKCTAFDSEIPSEIIFNEFDHTQKHPDQDNDITFEPINNENKK